ncbi:Hypothetical protein D9617_46g064300 [Elsinoe fawcettii]|nr:Hypothetical protein D9617_46g064300 [Elsinoe fawcettii]
MLAYENEDTQTGATATYVVTPVNDATTAEPIAGYFPYSNNYCSGHISLDHDFLSYDIAAEQIPAVHVEENFYHWIGQIAMQVPTASDYDADVSTSKSDEVDPISSDRTPISKPRPTRRSTPRRLRNRRITREKSIKKDATYQLERMKLSERALVTWKNQGKPWEEIRKIHSREFGEDCNIPALQMRWKRLRANRQAWPSTADEALQRAVQEYNKEKWDIINIKVFPFLCLKVTYTR